MSSLFSVDAETDGLYGEAFAIAVAVRVGGQQIASFLGRIPERLVRDEWVRVNVLPEIRGMPVTHNTSDDLEEAFWAFWLDHCYGATVIAHCGSPVESGLFRRCVERNLEDRKFRGPYPCLHDVGTLLMAHGHDPSSVDSYLGPELKASIAGSPHHPMHDAVSAAIAWEMLAEKQRREGGS